MSRVRLLSSIINRHRVFSQLPCRCCYSSFSPDAKKHALGPSTKNMGGVVNNTYEAYVQEALKHNRTSKVPQWLERLIAVTRIKLGRVDRSLVPELRVLLDKSSAQLYYSCANKIPYSPLTRAFGLPDALSSWFKLMILHLWMVLLRLHVSLEPAVYERFYRGMIASMWADIDKRMDIVKDITRRSATSQEMRAAQGMLLQALAEYDEGFLADDRMLAAAVWRNMFDADHFDPLYVLTVVRYIRDTVFFLDAIDTNDLMLAGIDAWGPAEKIDQEPE